ncbi:hypothetical protein LTR97_004817 [Elasticomyces elasticus]|uniref:Major facilitator superfamily (MFS) profile domain-containing protein n=1 Tax=Elasticomyces elasticus TaxID=574655 RepID=A0AAN8A3M4_9PEZI|nr:hypothetical protein LTR97_004817 [Elasticomyces elasticus]
MAHSSESTKSVSDLEKGDSEPVQATAQEEVEEQDEAEIRARSINTGSRKQDLHLRPQSTNRSVRSHHSYTDGYSHFGQDEDEKTSVDPAASHEVQFDGDADPYSPKNRSLVSKWLIVIILAASSMCVTCASALYTTTYWQLERDFHISKLVATVGLTTFVMGLAIGPMILSPLSEFYGRRAIYLAAFGMFFIWLIPCAVAPNAATMLVARFFDGLAGSAFLSVAGGTVGDMFTRETLSMPMMIYTASPFVGPQLGPVIGGFINQYTNWRWSVSHEYNHLSFYVLLIWAGIQWISIFFFVPETYAPVLLRRKAIKLRKETGDQNWKAPIEKMDRSVLTTVSWSIVRPFQLLIFEPMCLNLCMLCAVLLGILYLFFGVSNQVSRMSSRSNLARHFLSSLETTMVFSSGKQDSPSLVFSSVQSSASARTCCGDAIVSNKLTGYM